MKRDLEFLRRILLAIEASVDDEVASIRLPAGYDNLHISHHVRLLHEGGLIHAFESRSYSAVSSWVPHSLTWRGYELLAAIRDEASWQKLKQTIAGAGGDLPVEVVFDLALAACHARVAPTPAA